MSDIDDVIRLERMRHHYAETREQRLEVTRRFYKALLDEWVDGDYSWMSLRGLLRDTFGSLDPGWKDTEIICNIGDGSANEWETFPEMTDEWRDELRRRYFDSELQHTVDINELRRLGVIGENE